jgi:hypothetical protein
MIIDTRSSFAVSTTITESGILDVVDLGGPGSLSTQSPGVLVQMTEDATGSATSVQFSIETSASADLSSSTVLLASADIPVATLLAGYRVLAAALPPGDLLRYLGIRVTLTGGTLTTGRCSAQMADTLSMPTIYPED